MSWKPNHPSQRSLRPHRRRTSTGMRPSRRATCAVLRSCPRRRPHACSRIPPWRARSSGESRGVDLRSGGPVVQGIYVCIVEGGFADIDCVFGVASLNVHRLISLSGFERNGAMAQNPFSARRRITFGKRRVNLAKLPRTRTSNA